MAVKAGYPGYEQTAWARLTLGNLLEAYGDLDAAEIQYQSALDERENYPFAISALAELEMKRGNTKKAEALLKKAADIIPEFGFYVQLADLYKSTGRNTEAQQTIDEILLMLEDDVQHGHNMNSEYADIYLNLIGDYDKALHYALAEYKKRPDNIDVNKQLAFIFYAKGDYETSETHVVAASKTNSVHPELQCIRGLLAIQNGQNEAGQKDLRASWKANPFQSHVLAEQAQQLKS